MGRFDYKWLVGLTYKLKRHEKALAKVCWAIEAVIWKAQQALYAKVVSNPAINYINRRKIGNDTNEKPLYAGQKGLMMIGYSKVWTGLGSVIWRTHQLEEIKQRQIEEDG